MKTFMDLKVGDTVYKVIYAFGTTTPVRIQKEKVTLIEVVHSGTVIKTEDIVEEGALHGTHGYFVDSHWYDAKRVENNNNEIWWDKFAVQELINDLSVEYQCRISEMLDVLKD